MDVPSPSAGVVKEIKVAVGDKVCEGDVVLLLDAVEQADAPPDPPPAARRRRRRPSRRPSRSRRPRRRRRHLREPLGAPQGARGGIDLSTDRGLRPRRPHHARGPRRPRRRRSAAPRPAAGGEERVELSRIKKISGPHLQKSWQTIPHVTQHDEADITDLEAFRKRINSEQDVKVTMVALLMKACVASLKAHPEVNASLDGDHLILKRYYNLGFAADTPQGLLVPVIDDADGKGLLEIAAELRELSGRAREGKLKAEEMRGATFTISSLGGIGGGYFTPIINPPELAILGVSKSQMRPVWDGAQFVPRLMVPLSLSYDHRVIDGALAARFVTHLVERPVRPAPRAAVNVEVPDIGDFTDVPVIEILVAPGDTVEPEQPLITLESDKATMDVPSPAAGTIEEILVSVGDKVSQGTPIATLTADKRDSPQSPPEDDVAQQSQSQPESVDKRDSPLSPDAVDVVVVGAGPGGYTAAFRAADLGLERRAGRALRAARGRVPQRRLHPEQGAAAPGEGDRGGRGGADRLRRAGDRPGGGARVQGRRGRRSSPTGLVGLAKRRKIDVRHGEAAFTGPNTLKVGEDDRRVRARDHRRRQPGARDAAVPARGRPHRQLHRRARAARRAGAAARHRRRHHRPRDGDGLRRARRAGHRRRARGPAHPRLRPRPGQAAAEAHRGALRGRPPEDGHRVRRGEGGRAARRRRGLRPHPGRRRPPAQRRGRRRRRRRRDRDRPRLHRGRRPAAHQRRRTSSPSATSSASRCSRTRRRTRASSPPR